MKVNKKLVSLIRKLDRIRDEKKALEGALEKITKEGEDWQTKIVELMTTLNLTSVDVAGLGNCFLSRSVYPKVINEELLFNYLRKNGAENLIKYSVHPQTLKAYVREVMETKNEVPSGLEIFPKTKVSIKKEE
jgi:hypothetical protein